MVLQSTRLFRSSDEPMSGVRGPERTWVIFSPQVNMIKDDGTVIHFNNPKVQASLSANTFAITGHAESKQLTEMLPGILSQLGADSLSSLRKLAEQFPRQGGSARNPSRRTHRKHEDYYYFHYFTLCISTFFSSGCL